MSTLGTLDEVPALLMDTTTSMIGRQKECLVMAITQLESWPHLSLDRIYLRRDSIWTAHMLAISTMILRYEKPFPSNFLLPDMRSLIGKLVKTGKQVFVIEKHTNITRCSYGKKSQLKKAI